MTGIPPLPQQDRGWTQLFLTAGSADDGARQLAVIRAFSWLEHALVAAGLKKERDPTARILKRAYENGWIDFRVAQSTLLMEFFRKCEGLPEKIGKDAP